jgi:hypothetical protein
MNLKERIFDCLPAGRYALSGLLRLLDVVVTEEIPSAAVECHKTPRLLINPSFVAVHAQTNEKLMMLVLHEIHHVLLGHTKRLPSKTKADNFVFDCVINAMLCRMFAQPEYTALFTDYYPEDLFPHCMLRPPSVWNPKFKGFEVPKGLQDPKFAAARSVYQSLYSVEGASYDEIRRVLPQVLVKLNASGLKKQSKTKHPKTDQHKTQQSNPIAEEVTAEQTQLQTGQAFDWDSVPLLGDHEQSVHGQSSASEGAFASALTQIIAEWPCPPEPIKGQSLHGILKSAHLGIQKPPGCRSIIKTLIKRIADQNERGSTLKRLERAKINFETPIPVHSRRTLVCKSLGSSPLLYTAETEHEKLSPFSERIHIYVDVSGSMDAIKGAIYGAVLDCEQLIFPKIHLFSTQVNDISVRQLRSGYCKSTGGTDIDCVVKHMRAHQVKNALLLTDGFVGEPTGELKTYFQKVRLGVAYTKDHISRDLTKYSKTSAVLPI